MKTKTMKFKSLIASAVLCTILTTVVAPRRSEAAIVITAMKIDNSSESMERKTDQKRMLFGGICLLPFAAAAHVFGGLAIPALTTPITLFLFLDQEVNGTGSINEQDLINNGYSSVEAKQAVIDADRFREILRKEGKTIGISREDTVDSISQAIRKIYPDASDAFVSITAQGAVQANQGR